mgnify:CR=1 FL=1
MRHLRVWAYFIRLSMRSALEDWKLSAMSVLSVAMLSAFLFATLTAFRTVETTFLAFGRNAVVIAFAEGDAVPALREKIQGALCKGASILSCSERTSQEARADFVRENPDLSSTVGALDENPFLHSFHVRLQPSERPLDAIIQVATELRGMPGVVSVEDGEKWLLGWSQSLRFFREGFWILGGLVAACVLFLFSTVISLVVHRQKNQMDILSLVGATRFTIALPFAAQGIFQTFVGGGLAAILLHEASGRLRESMAREFGITLVQWTSYAWWEAWAIVGGLCALGALGSALAVRRCLKEAQS